MDLIGIVSAFGVVYVVVLLLLLLLLLRVVWAGLYGRYALDAEVDSDADAVGDIVGLARSKSLGLTRRRLSCAS